MELGCTALKRLNRIKIAAQNFNRAAILLLTVVFVQQKIVYKIASARSSLFIHQYRPGVAVSQ